MIKYNYIIANWKLNGNKNLLDIFFKKLNFIDFETNNIKIIIAPPIVYLDYACNLFKSKKNIYICSQNIDINNKGAFTGEISSYMLNEIGVKYTILGHSERRIIHNESNINIMKKFNISKQNNLIPILCIGENKKEFDEKKSLEICINQIKSIIDINNIKLLYNSIIAYEPIWSIGTNILPDFNHINYINNSILNYLYSIDKNIINNIDIVYGGSISSKNIKNFIDNKNINGFLIGRSSLYIDEFLKIINFYIKK